MLHNTVRDIRNIKKRAEIKKPVPDIHIILQKSRVENTIALKNYHIEFIWGDAST